MVFNPDRILELPILPSESVTYSFNTSVTTSDAKVERRRAKNLEPLARFELGEFVLKQQELEYLQSFYQNSNSTVDTFLYKSSVDFAVTNVAVNTNNDPNFLLYEIGKGVRITNTTDRFYLFRSFELLYTPQASSFTGKLVALPSTHLDTISLAKTGIRTPFVSVTNVYYNGVLQAPSTYTVDTQTGIVTTDGTDVTGVNITWEGEYYFPVRFDNDQITYSRAGKDLYAVTGLILQQERIDDRLHDLKGSPYYIAEDFNSVDVSFELPFIPEESINYNMPFIGKQLENKIEKRTPFYTTSNENISIESNVITLKEKNYLRNFFMVMKGKLNSFYYDSEPKRYAEDSFTLTAVSGLDSNSCVEQLYEYNSFNLEGVIETGLKIDKDTKVELIIDNSFDSETANKIADNYNNGLRQTLNNGIFSEPGALGSAELANFSGSPYLRVYIERRDQASLGTSRNLLLIHVTKGNDPEYYDKGTDQNPRSQTKKTNEPTSTWQADYADFQTRWLLGDTFIVLQIDKVESEFYFSNFVLEGQALTDQIRDAVRSRSVYEDNGLGLKGKGAQILKHLPTLPADIDIQDLVCGEFLSLHNKTLGTFMRIKSPASVTFNHTISLANALQNPAVVAGLEEAVAQGNLVATAGSVVTGGVDGGGNVNPSVGGCKVYLYDRFNLRVLEVNVIPGSDSTLTQLGQCTFPPAQYDVQVDFRDNSSNIYTILNFGVFSGPITAIIPGIIRDATNTSAIMWYDAVFGPDNQEKREDNGTQTFIGGVNWQVDNVIIQRQDDPFDACAGLNPFDVNDLQEVGSVLSVNSMNVGQPLPDCVFFVDIDNGDVYSQTTSVASQCFFDFTFSTLDACIRLGDGLEFLGQYAINSLATSKEVNLSTDNQTIDSVFNDSNILTPNKIAAGLLAGSQAEIYLIDWLNVPNTFTDGIPLLTGTVGETKFNENGYTFQVRSFGELLNKPINRKTSPKCDYLFGGSECLLDLDTAGLRAEAEVLTFDASTRRIQFTTSFLTGFFLYGSIFIYTGTNASLRLTISSIVAPDVLEYQGSLVDEIYPGDVMLVTAFCGKDQVACKAYNNFVNFGGVPVGGNFVPSLNVITVP